ncbi:MAG: type VI secretion system lipoprotein TssJ [Methylococcaceae bacterium]|nr:type VI secretion system lipoprotein TssJ [Methylococcaceae bacterium]
MLDASTRNVKCVLHPPFQWVFFLLAPSFSGCSSLFESEPPPPPAPPPPTVIELKLETSKDLNLTREGNATPIVARVYELKSSDGFSNADFFAIYDQDKDILASDIVYREELELTPAQSRQIRLEPKPESRFIGIFGAFRDLETAQWRVVEEIPPNKTTVMRVHFAKNSVAIDVAKENPPVAEEVPPSE